MHRESRRARCRKSAPSPGAWTTDAAAARQPHQEAAPTERNTHWYSLNDGAARIGMTLDTGSTVHMPEGGPTRGAALIHRGSPNARQPWLGGNTTTAVVMIWSWPSCPSFFRMC